MFNSITSAVRRFLSKMGIIKGIKNLTEHKAIAIDESFYNHIVKWKALYSGYFSEWHDIEYMTINGTKQRKMATLQMPKTVSQELATLIFNERCEINISDETFSDEIKTVFKNNNFQSKFQDSLEFMFALGGMVIKPFVQDNEIKLSYVTADCFLPISWDNKRVTEGVFINAFKRQGKNYTHLEWHLWEQKAYVIKNEVYESVGGNELGVKVNLKQFFPNLEENVLIRDITVPMFVYSKPNMANNIDPTVPLGISVFANALDTLKSIDIAFDSFQREFRLGKKRIIVPDSAIKTVVDPQTGQMQRYFDANDEVYEAMAFGNMDSDQIKDITIELRVDEHISAINALLNLLSMQIGFSSGAFSFDGNSVVATKTATEIVSENSKTFRTKQSHENVIEAGLTELVECIGQLAELYSLFSRPKEYEVTVAFDDSIAEDKTAEISKQIQLVNNGLTTKVKAIMSIHGYSEEEAEELLAQIKEEQATANAEAIDMFGVNK